MALVAGWAYLRERFPVSQAGAVVSAYACCYLLYGQIDGHQAVHWPTLIGAMTIVLLALVRRIVDDVDDLREDLQAGHFSAVDGGRARLRGLGIGALIAITLAGALNATCSPALLGMSVGIGAWFAIATALRGTAENHSRALEYVIVETCPAVLLIYSYAVWVEATHSSLPGMAVIAIVGLFWTTFQFWSFTRKIGRAEWGPWGLDANGARPVLVLFLLLTAIFNALITHYAHLSVGYLLYGLALPGFFIALVLRRWSQLPAQDLRRVGAAWAGMPFGVAVEVGVLIAVLVSSI